ncbi:hypothetical protein [Solidesulfovibrio aerotolerans]|uniref:hypothetical protein n=1 Tax=Solidesulfovibrio aerotolerans TaxID=295255 RepID=UPI0013706CC2|nr:hypothetical protein [Solidesulfovibrio aerotolerans]
MFVVDERVVLFFGVVYQFIGLAVSLYVLNQSKNFFKYPTVGERLRSLKSAFLLRQECKEGSVSAVAVGKGKIYGHRVLVIDERSASEKIEQLEDFCMNLSNKIVSLHQLVDSIDAKLLGMISDNENSINGEISRLEALVESNSIGYVPWLEVGICSFAVGVLLSSFPSLVVKFVVYVKACF